MYKGTTIYTLLGKYVAKIIGYSTIYFFFSKNSLSLNIFSTREDSNAKKKCLQEDALKEKKITEVH